MAQALSHPLRRPRSDHARRREADAEADPGRTRPATRGVAGCRTFPARGSRRRAGTANRRLGRGPKNLTKANRSTSVIVVVALSAVVVLFLHLDAHIL